MKRLGSRAGLILVGVTAALVVMAATAAARTTAAKPMAAHRPTRMRVLRRTSPNSPRSAAVVSLGSSGVWIGSRATMPRRARPTAELIAAASFASGECW